MWQLYVVSDKGCGYERFKFGPEVSSLTQCATMIKLGEHIFNEWVEASRELDTMCIQPFEWLAHWEGSEIEAENTDNKKIMFLDEDDVWEEMVP